MSKFVTSFLKDESGASAAEYVLILAIVGVALVATLGGLATAMQGKLTEASTAISGAN